MKKFPFQQGDLDDYCSIYALINLIAAREGELCEDCEGKICAVCAHSYFVEMINAVHGEGNLRLTTIDGIGPSDIQWLAASVDQSMSWTNTPSIEEVKAAANNTAIVFCTFNSNNIDPADPRTHYTVLKYNMQTSTFELYDSYGYNSFTLEDEKCFLDEEQITVTDVFW